MIENTVLEQNKRIARIQNQIWDTNAILNALLNLRNEPFDDDVKRALSIAITNAETAKLWLQEARDLAGEYEV